MSSSYFSTHVWHVHFTCTSESRGFVPRAVILSLAVCLSLLAPSVCLSAAFAAVDSAASAKLHANALKAEKVGNLRDAIELEQQAARDSPGNFLYKGELARLLWAIGYVDRAQKECREALNLAPDNAKCRLNLALMLQTVGDPKAAIVEYEKVLKLSPGNLQARLGLLQSLSLAGRSQDAVNQLDRLARDGKRQPLALLDVADTAIKIDQPHRAKEMLRDAAATGNARALQLLYLAAARDGDEQLALSIQKKVLDSAPKDRRVYLIAAQLAQGKGGVWLQEQILNVSMKAVKGDGDLYVQMAGMFAQNFTQARASGDDKDAQAWLDLADKALTFAEDMNVSAWRYRFAHAGIFALKGKHKEAADIIDELARQEPKNELISYCRGHLRSHSNNPAAMAKRNLKTLLGETDKSGVSSNAPLDTIILACSRAYFDKLGCGCHTGVLEFKWKRSSGVLYAKVISQHPAVALIVHQLGDIEGFKGRIISAAGTINERVMKVETETVKGLGALALNVAAPEAQEEPPLMARLVPPELQRL
ncbi:MAG: hypothetical protein C0469_09650 [Cyanobacteria bacterium DS2.3.42]|nr:hypothetical protein [Cyanobacteria bacterium DS2.3.42]